MGKLLKISILFLAVALILGCEKKGAFEKMGSGMDKSAAKMDKTMREMAK